MKKYLLITGLLAVLTFNSAHARDYYYEDDGYYEERPRYTRHVATREESPRYRRISSKETPRYREPTYHQEEYYGEPKTNRIRPYIGLDIATQETVSPSTESISGVIGVKINKNFGIEAYYQQSEGSHKTSTKYYSKDGESIYDEDKTFSYKSYGADLIGYMPVTQEFELLIALGLGQYDFENKGTLTENGTVFYGDDEFYNYTETSKYKKNTDSLGVRLGFGAQYNITDNIALRGMFRYIKMTNDDYVKNLTELSLGLRYMF